MIIEYMSDLHTNHWIPFVMNQLKWEERTRKFVRSLFANAEGDVLVISGDFSESNNQSVWVLEEASERFKRVYWTYGNHDMYLLSKRDHKRYKGYSERRVDELIERTYHLANVVCLNKIVDVYEGVTFAGDVMWYLPENEEDWAFLNEVSNDSVYVKDKEMRTVENTTRKFNRESVEFFNGLVGTQIDVFVSHVPPLSEIGGESINSCYRIDVDLGDVSIGNWICGHVHTPWYERVGVTDVRMNPLGYPGEIYSKDELFEEFWLYKFEVGDVVC